MIASPFLASSAPTIWGESVFWMVAERPIFAAIAWAMSISKPTPCRVAGSIDSWGGQPGSARKAVLPGATTALGGRRLGAAGLAGAPSDGGGRISIGPEAERRLRAARDLVDRLVREDRVVYGLTTGVGALKNVRIPPADGRQLQRNLLMSHAAGVGPPLPEELVRAGMLVRINQFCQGTSGVSPKVAERLVELLNRDVCARVPAKGALRASRAPAPSAPAGPG